MVSGQALKLLLRTWHRERCKVLLFSYSTQMLDILQDFCGVREGYSYLRLDGSTSTAEHAREPLQQQCGAARRPYQSPGGGGAPTDHVGAAASA